MMYRLLWLSLIGPLLPFAVLSVSAVALAQPVTVMSFNAENLFDTHDDRENPGENTYLPLALKNKRRPLHDIACDAYYKGHPSFLDQCKTLDWNDQVYAKKLERLAGVIKALTPRPDVIVMQEVENKQVLDDLVGRNLPGDAYRVIQLDTSEKIHNRGIDVGMLTRLELAGKPTAHRVYFGSDGKFCGGAVRDILAVPLRLPDGETLHIFGVHLTPGDTRLVCRIHAIKRLNELAARLPQGSLAMAVGDFNIGCKEVTTDTVTELLAEGGWFASPIISHGCDFPGSFHSYESPPATPEEWSFLDLILVSAALNPEMPTSKNWFADLGSFATVIVDPEQVAVDEENQGYIVPQLFDPVTGHGVSDHFPVIMRLMTRRN